MRTKCLLLSTTDSVTLLQSRPVCSHIVFHMLLASIGLVFFVRSRNLTVCHTESWKIKPAAQDVPVMNPRHRVVLIAMMRCHCTSLHRPWLILVTKNCCPAISTSRVYLCQSKIICFRTRPILCISVISSRLFTCRLISIARLFRLPSISVCQQRLSSLCPPRLKSQCHSLIVLSLLAFLCV